MGKQQPICQADISREDWERTPASVKHLVESLTQQVEGLSKQLAILEDLLEQLQVHEQLSQEQLRRNSSNSSQPPSSDRPRGFKLRRQGKSGKQRGGQPGHKGHHRYLYAVEQCESVKEHYPETCGVCGAKLTGQDPEPYRHQIIEIPAVQPRIEEHRLHQLVCECCGESTRAKLPESVPSHRYGPRVTATVALLSGQYRHSQRLVQQAMADLFGVVMSLGSVNNLRHEASKAVAEPVETAKEYARQQPMVGSDETSFAQGNVDGQNPDHRKGWLWVVVTPLVTVFEVFLRHSQQSAKEFLGKAFGSILISDRHSAYNWVALGRRQVCWAHLKRDFTKMAERTGVSQALGEALLEQEKKLFDLWYRVRDGTLSRAEFMAKVQPIRQRVHQLLAEGAAYSIAPKEKTPLAKTVRTCRRLLKVEPAMWSFVTIPGVEPTNNASERALRPAVIWRNISFGAQTQAGSQFVARMLTVVTTLRSQKRNVLDYLTEACQAARQGQPAPSLLPK